MIPVQIAGLSGYKILYLKADLYLPVKTAGGQEHIIVIKDVFYDPQGHYNLISSDQLNMSSYNVRLEVISLSCCHVLMLSDVEVLI